MILWWWQIILKCDLETVSIEGLQVAAVDEYKHGFGVLESVECVCLLTITCQWYMPTEKIGRSWQWFWSVHHHPLTERQWVCVSGAASGHCRGQNKRTNGNCRICLESKSQKVHLWCVPRMLFMSVLWQYRCLPFLNPAAAAAAARTEGK